MTGISPSNLFLLALLAWLGLAKTEEAQMKSFWRNAPLVDRWMKGGHFLQNLPTYLTATDFPPANSHNVVAFADGISTVRILGGWRNLAGNKQQGENADRNYADTDVFVKKYSSECNIPAMDFFVCPQRLTDRILPYAQAGVTDITIVLDNIPEFLANRVSFDYYYGQNGPPRNEKISWHMGYQVAKILKSSFPEIKFRYRVGTECGERNRFNGTEQQYFEHYTRISDAIHKHVGSDIEVMPFNQAGYWSTDFHKNVSMQRLASRLGKRTVYSSQPLSLYLQKRDRVFPTSLRKRVEEMTAYWDELDRERSARGHGGKLTREVHELGVMRYPEASPGEVVSDIQLAAFHAEAIMRFAAAGVDKVFHWHNAFAPGSKLLTPTGWVYCVLDSMVGGVWNYPSIKVASGDDKSEYFAAISRHNDRSILMISSLNADERIVEWKTPNTVVDVRYFHNDAVISKQNACMTWVRENSFQSQTDIVESLTLKPFEGNMFVRGNTIIIRPLVKTNSVTVLVFDKNGC